jgi:hypothetical protein
MAKAMCRTMAFFDRRDGAKIEGLLHFFASNLRLVKNAFQVADLAWFYQISP